VHQYPAAVDGASWPRFDPEPGGTDAGAAGGRRMVAMPHRSVTRFFIPLIDVLLLLFGIFLLMPIAKEGELEDEREKTGEEAASVEVLRYELTRRDQELQRLEDLRPKLDQIDKLQKELEQLRQAN